MFFRGGRGTHGSHHWRSQKNQQGIKAREHSHRAGERDRRVCMGGRCSPSHVTEILFELVYQNRIVCTLIIIRGMLYKSHNPLPPFPIFFL